MSNELYEHKRSDTVKWILTLLAFILVGVMLAGIILGWFEREEEAPAEEEQTEQTAIMDGEGNAMDAAALYRMPERMTFTSAALISERSAQVRIEAYVYPENAANREVDFSLAWGNAPTNGDGDVTDFVTVTPEGDGCRVATVACQKAFGEDTILLTATTRDGGYQATCTIVYVGHAEGIVVTTADAIKTSSASRGEYYALGTNGTYTFNILLSNAYDSVNGDLQIKEFGAVGALYFGDGYSNDGGYLNFSNVTQRDLNDMLSTFIRSVSLSGSTLTVKTGGMVVENYYSGIGPNEDYTVEYLYDRYVVEVRDDTMGYKQLGDTFNNSYAKYNAENVGSCYFYVTVEDSVSGLSETIRLWLESSVNGIALSAKTMEF